MIIRREKPDDTDAVFELLVESFPTHGEAKLVDALRSGNHLDVALVAIEQACVVGFIGFSPATTESGAPGLGLAPVAVHSSKRGRGVARQLIQQGLANCREFGCPWVVVLGEPAFYKRFRFRPAAEFDLVDEYGGGDAFQALELASNSLAGLSGVVRYGPEFALLE